MGCGDGVGLGSVPGMIRAVGKARPPRFPKPRRSGAAESLKKSQALRNFREHLSYGEVQWAQMSGDAGIGESALK